MLRRSRHAAVSLGITEVLIGTLILVVARQDQCIEAWELGRQASPGDRT